MRRFAAPQWRIPGAILAWLLFSFGFTVVYLSADALARLGGFCATGGPYEIATTCTEAITLFMPLGFFLIFVAGAVALIFQGGFSTPLIVWGWPILFVGLGIQFFAMIPLGAVFVGILCGTLFVLMGVAPLIFELRAGPRRVLLGKSDTRDVRFTDKPGAPRTFYAFGRDDPATTRAATGGDWALSLACSLLPLAAGTVLGVLAFGSVAAA